MKEQLQEIWNKRPLIISGPCSAETEEQVMATAQRLAATGKVDLLRAGIWKPRTKPGMFEGIGDHIENAGSTPAKSTIFSRPPERIWHSLSS
jgi:3-deoxy-D-arabino-heptulosonate 7-phosphate (DAHP) synthase